LEADYQGNKLAARSLVYMYWV